MKIISALFVVVLPFSAQAESILTNPCFAVDKSGELKRLNGLVGCNDQLKSFDASSAEGSRGGENYAIKIQKEESGTAISVFEMDGVNTLLPGHFPSLTQTVVKKGEVADQTFCSRIVSKTKPLVKNESMTCITLDSNVCGAFFKKLKEMDSSIKAEDIKKCESITSRTLFAVQGALNESWKSEEYGKQAKDRIDQVRDFSDKQMTKEMKKKTSNNFSFSDTSPDTGFLKVVSTTDGLKLMSEISSKCNSLFPQSAVAGVNSTGKTKTAQ